jgi:hypothetical protein
MCTEYKWVPALTLMSTPTCLLTSCRTPQQILLANLDSCLICRVYTCYNRQRLFITLFVSFLC